MTGGDEETADDQGPSGPDEPVADPATDQRGAKDERRVDTEECRRVCLAEALTRPWGEGAVLGLDEVEDQQCHHAVEREALPHLDQGERDHAPRLPLLHAESVTGREERRCPRGPARPCVG